MPHSCCPAFLCLQGRFENSTRVQVSRAAGQLLRHAFEEDATEQETHIRGDRGQTKGSGMSKVTDGVNSWV